jgi:hypothetical protein
MESDVDRGERAEAILKALDVAEERERIEEAGVVERQAERLQGARPEGVEPPGEPRTAP